MDGNIYTSITNEEKEEQKKWNKVKKMMALIYRFLIVNVSA